MKKTTYHTLLLLILFAGLFSSCNSNEPDIPENAALIIVGKVDQEVGWLEETIRTMDSIDVEASNSKGESDVYTGVYLKSLLDEAGVQPEAASVVFFADDDSSSGEIPLTDVISCEKCIVSFRTKGGFSIVAPDLGKDAQVKGVVRIEVK